MTTASSIDLGTPDMTDTADNGTVSRMWHLAPNEWTLQIGDYWFEVLYLRGFLRLSPINGTQAAELTIIETSKPRDGILSTDRMLLTIQGALT